jgi:bis(5'-nucleosyl)-tetraphosphatase (symmetrical)
MANYAIGDIQGCYKEFRLALKKVNFDIENDYLWLVGDLINRGPDSLKLIKYLYKIRKRTHIVLGNHELHFLSCLYGQRELSKTDTLSKLIKTKKSQKYAEFLIQQPLIFQKKIEYQNKSKRIIMVHAGVPPNLSLAKCLNLNKDFQIAIRKNPKKILKKIFSNSFSEFSKKMSSIDQLVFFTNALTRIRICNQKGKIDFKFKGKISQMPKKYDAWFNFRNSFTNKNSQLIFGHWAAIKGKTEKKNILGLDTGCVWGDKLTIMRLEDNKRFQIKKIKEK